MLSNWEEVPGRVFGGGGPSGNGDGGGVGPLVLEQNVMVGERRGRTRNRLRSPKKLLRRT